MSLDNILRMTELAGLVNDGEGLVNAVNQDPYINIGAAMNIVGVKHGEPNLFEQGYHKPEAFEHIDPTKKRRIAREWHEENKQKLTKEAEKNYDGVIKTLKNKKKGELNIANVILDFEPAMYRGRNARLARAHKRAYETEAVKSIKSLAELEKAIELMAKDVKGNAIGKAMLALVRNNPELSINVLSKYAERVRKEFYDAFKSAREAGEYLADIYRNADEKEKKEVAYRSAAALAQKGEARIVQLNPREIRRAQKEEANIIQMPEDEERLAA